MSYINREDAIYAIKKAGGCIGIHDCFETRCGTCQINFALSAVNDLPSADVIGRKTGKWIYNTDDFTPKRRCSECGYNFPIPAGEGIVDAPKAFCANCGVKMEG